MRDSTLRGCYGKPFFRSGFEGSETWLLAFLIEVSLRNGSALGNERNFLHGISELISFLTGNK
jgi:hypothetical protein